MGTVFETCHEAPVEVPNYTDLQAVTASQPAPDGQSLKQPTQGLELISGRGRQHRFTLNRPDSSGFPRLSQNAQWPGGFPDSA